MRLVVGDWEFLYNDEGSEYIAKALPIKKSIHSEQPPYKVCNELEDAYEKKLFKDISVALKDIVKYLNVNSDELSNR